MKIGVIGAGPIGKAFANHVAKSGFEVLLANSRGPETLTEIVKEIGNGIKAVTASEATQADVVFLGMNFRQMKDAIAALPSLAGKVVIDPSNAIVFPEFKPQDLGGRTSSEIVAELIPGAFLVKAFNTIPAAVLASDPRTAGGNRVVFPCGDDKEAKKKVKEIITKTGFFPIDLGKLIPGGKMQEFGGPLPSLNLIHVP